MVVSHVHLVEKKKRNKKKSPFFSTAAACFSNSKARERCDEREGQEEEEEEGRESQVYARVGPAYEKRGARTTSPVVCLGIRIKTRTRVR